MDPLLSWSRKNQPALIRFIRTLVECESPTDSPEAVSRCAELLADSLTDIADGRTIPNKTAGRTYVCDFRLPGRDKSNGNKTGRILALGHSDTVWPMGTIRTMKFRNHDGRLWGPGVLDMKSGLAIFAFAMRALRDLKIPVTHQVRLLVNPDEETGSATSRQLTENEAKQSRAVLVLEPGTGLEGKAKTARKGIGSYHVTVRGVAAHSGVDFEKGASAILELSRQISEKIAGFTDLKRGITVNPGVISGGTRSNVTAAFAETHVDIRIPRAADAASLDKKFRSLKPFDKRCSLEITGGLNRPPMERSKGTAELFHLAKALASDLGVTLDESSTGGGSDGNFTAALGIPTLDGIGAVGEGAHATHESVLVDRLADRVALLARLVAGIG